MFSHPGSGKEKVYNLPFIYTTGSDEVDLSPSDSVTALAKEKQWSIRDEGGIDHYRYSLILLCHFKILRLKASDSITWDIVPRKESRPVFRLKA